MFQFQRRLRRFACGHEDVMAKFRKVKFNGIANFFKESELKSLFLKYIQLIIVVEVVILIIMLAGFAANRSEPFPTKLYLFLAFGIPLAITFLLGTVIQAFGKYVYGDSTSKNGHQGDDSQNSAQIAPPGTGIRLWRKLSNAPYLVKILLFLIAVVLVFKLEDMLGFIARTGSQAFDSLILIMVALISAATLIGLIWMLAAFRLRNKQMDYHHQYRKDILERLELMVLDDETIIDKKGNIIPIKNKKLIGETSVTLVDEYHVQPKKIEEKTRTHE